MRNLVLHLHTFITYTRITSSYSTNSFHFPIRKYAVEENISIFTVLKGDERFTDSQKNKYN